MTLYFTSIMVYFSMLLMMIGFYDLILFWVLSELLTLGFIYVSFTSSNKDLKFFSPFFFFFIIQSLASLSLFFLFVCLDMSSFYNKSFLLFFCIGVVFLKMGLYPLSSWVYKVFSAVSPLSLTIFLIPHKTPFVLFVSHVSSGVSVGFLLFSMVVGSLFIFFSSSPSNMVISSSIYGISWLLLFYESSNFYFFLLFLIFYSLFTFKALSTLVGSQGYFFLFFFLLGLPPLMLFFFKVLSFFSLTEFSFLIFSFTIWVCTFVASMGYLKFFYYYFTKFRTNLSSGMTLSSFFSVFLSIFLSLVFFS